MDPDTNQFNAAHMIEGPPPDEAPRVAGVRFAKQLANKWER